MGSTLGLGRRLPHRQSAQHSFPGRLAALLPRASRFSADRENFLSPPAQSHSRTPDLLSVKKVKAANQVTVASFSHVAHPVATFVLDVAPHETSECDFVLLAACRRTIPILVADCPGSASLINFL